MILELNKSMKFCKSNNSYNEYNYQKIIKYSQNKKKINLCIEKMKHLEIILEFSNKYLKYMRKI